MIAHKLSKVLITMRKDQQTLLSLQFHHQQWKYTSKALIVCISIAYMVTCTDSYIGLAGAVIIGLIAVVLWTSKTPPLCQLACSN